MATIWEKIGYHGVQLKTYSDELFAEGNRYNPYENSAGKNAVVIFDEEDLLHESRKEFVCHVPGCVKKFQTVFDFEGHYNTLHRNACEICHKRFQTQHLLDLHVMEKHDSFFLAQAERKPMYRCFLDTCPVRCSTPAERRSHCIEVHSFPHDFRFDDSRKQKKAQEAESMDVSEAISQSRCKSDGLPKSFSFGRGVSRGFSRRPRQWHQIHASPRRETTADVNLADMEEALPQLT